MLILPNNALNRVICTNFHNSLITQELALSRSVTQGHGLIGSMGQLPLWLTVPTFPMLQADLTHCGSFTTTDQ